MLGLYGEEWQRKRKLLMGFRVWGLGFGGNGKENKMETTALNPKP